MKVALAIALVVVVAAIVECAPSISGQSKRQGGEKEGWPAAWIEFTELVGQCHASEIWMKALNITISENDAEYLVLGQACPIAYGLAGAYVKGTTEQQRQVEEIINDKIKLIQCVNMEAVAESVALSYWYLHVIYGSIDDALFNDAIYQQESEPLFQECQQKFGEFKEQEEQFEEDLKAAGVEFDKKREFQMELERLLSIVAKKR